MSSHDPTCPQAVRWPWDRPVPCECADALGWRALAKEAQGECAELRRALMTDHDPLHSGDIHMSLEECGVCDLIREARAEEQSHGWRHLAMEANAKAVRLMQERDDLRAKVAAMPDSIGRSGRAAGDLLWRNAVLALFDGTDSR